jgi:hypothetical protein
MKRRPRAGTRAAPAFMITDDRHLNTSDPANPQDVSRGPQLVAKLDALLGGNWPGKLRDSFDPAASPTSGA